MVSNTVVDLREASSWDPSRLTVGSFEWPDRAMPLVALRAVSVVIRPESWVETDVPVITPSSLDPVIGGIRRRSRKYKGAAFQVGTGKVGLHPGDLLVPLREDLPVLLVRPKLAGAMVSSHFVALRLVEGSPEWVWGVLNSSSGRTLRGRLLSGSVNAGARAALLDMATPWPSWEEQERVVRKLREIERDTHIPEEEATGTWWRTADLRERDWHLALATPDPELLEDGIPISELASKLARGRSRSVDFHEAPGPGLLPVVDISSLGGKGVRRWVSPEGSSQIVAAPGDVVVAAVGARPHAALVHEIAVVDRNLFWLRLHSPYLGPALVQYLNGTAGYGMRQMLLTGDFIPGLRKDALAQLPVPVGALEDLTHDDPPQLPLADRLERVLWS